MRYADVHVLYKHIKRIHKMCVDEEFISVIYNRYGHKEVIFGSL